MRLAVLGIALQFGPERAVPVVERARRAFPAASEEDIAQAIAWADAVQARAYELTSVEGADAARRLREQFPELPRRVVRRVVAQAHYWHLRD